MCVHVRQPVDHLVTTSARRTCRTRLRIRFRRIRSLRKRIRSLCRSPLTVGYAIFGNKGRSPYNGKLSDFSFYIDSQISVHRKIKK
jgi:hypothetical protein